MSLIGPYYYLDMKINPNTGLHEIREGNILYSMHLDELYKLIKYCRSFWPNWVNLPTVKGWFDSLDDLTKRKVSREEGLETDEDREELLDTDDDI